MFRRCALAWIWADGKLNLTKPGVTQCVVSFSNQCHISSRQSAATLQRNDMCMLRHSPHLRIAQRSSFLRFNHCCDTRLQYGHYAVSHYCLLGVFFLHDTTAPSGPVPSHYQGFATQTHHSIGLLWMSDQPVAETSTWQHSQQTSMPPGGIRTRSFIKRAAADPRLRSRGHWDRQALFSKYKKRPAVETTSVCVCVT